MYNKNKLEKTINWLIYNIPNETPEGWLITIQADSQSGEVLDEILFKTKDEADDWLLEQIMKNTKTGKPRSGRKSA